MENNKKKGKQRMSGHSLKYSDRGRCHYDGDIWAKIKKKIARRGT